MHFNYSIKLHTLIQSNRSDRINICIHRAAVILTLAQM